MAVAGPGVRTARAGRTREQLYGAALELVAARGWDATTMDDIAVAAGTSRRTAFNHFPAKGDLTVEWTERRRAHAADVAGSRHPGERDVVARLRTYVGQLALISEKAPAETTQMVLGWLGGYGPVRQRTAMPGQVAGWLAAGQRVGVVAAAVDPGRTAEMVYDLYLGALFRWIGDGTPGPGRIVDDVVTALDPVLATLSP